MNSLSPRGLHDPNPKFGPRLSPVSSLEPPLTKVSRVVVGGAVQAKTLQIGNQVGNHTLEDALSLAQDVELRQKGTHEKNMTSERGRGALTLLSQASLLGDSGILTLSNISKSLALGWWMVQMTVRPPWASDFMRDTTWKQEALSRPLSRERSPGTSEVDVAKRW